MDTQMCCPAQHIDLGFRQSRRTLGADRHARLLTALHVFEVLKMWSAWPPSRFRW